jgi:hypothetical protein
LAEVDVNRLLMANGESLPRIAEGRRLKASMEGGVVITNLDIEVCVNVYLW